MPSGAAIDIMQWAAWLAFVELPEIYSLCAFYVHVLIYRCQVWILPPASLPRFSWAGIKKYHNLGGLSSRNCLVVLWARSQGSSCLYHGLLWGLGRSKRCRPVSRLLEVVNSCWIVDASFQYALILTCVHMSVSVHISPFDQDASCVGLGPILKTHVDLITAVKQNIFK